MRRIQRLILGLIVLVCAAVGVIYYRMHTAAQETADATPPPPRRTDKKLRQQNFEYTKHEGTRPIVRVIAKEFTQVGDSDKYDLVDVELRLFHKDGKAFDQVKSKKAQFDQMSGILFSEGDVEIVKGVPDEEKMQTGRLLTIRSSGVEYDSKNGRAKTDRPASFTFDRGDGQATGAIYDPGTRELTMMKDVVLHWKAATPKQKDMEVQAGNLVYKEKESRIYLSPWSKLKRDTLSMEGANSVVTLLDGALQLVEADKAKGVDKSPARTLEFASERIRMEFEPGGDVKGITGEQNAKVVSLTTDSQMTVTSDRVDMAFGPDNLLQTALANGNGTVESKPVPKASTALADTRILRSDQIVLSMDANGKEVKHVETLKPGSVEFIPNRPGPKHRTMTGDHMWIDYGPENRIRQFRATAVTTRTDNPPLRGKTPAPPSLTWSKDLTADFDPKSGQMVKLEQTTDFRYEEGDRKARSDKAVLDYSRNVITLDGPGSRVWDPTGSTVADHIQLNEVTGDVDAVGNVSSVREPERGGKKPGSDAGLLSSTEPVQAKANRMTATHQNAFIRYLGNALLWQGANRLQADTVEIDRDKSTIAAHGNVVSQFVDRSKPKSGAQGPSPKNVFTVVKAPDMVYRDGEKMAHYTGGVHLNRPGMVVDSAELRAFLKPDEGSDSNLDRALATGAVKILQTAGDRRRTSTSDRAEYFVAEGRIVLDGGEPQLIDGNKITRGSKLTYFQANDRLLVNGVEAQPAISNIRK